MPTMNSRWSALSPTRFPVEGRAPARPRPRRSPALQTILVILVCAFLSVPLSAEDGYRLWLRHDRVENARPVASIVLATPGGHESATLAAARRELVDGLSGLTGAAPRIELTATSAEVPDAGKEGYALRGTADGQVRISANSDLGALYGAYALLRHLQLGQGTRDLNVTSQPKISRRLLNHWDNLNRTVERGYAGFSLWEWFVLPDHLSPRYRDYARACASLGLNGAVLTNVNADALILTPRYLAKVAALAGEFRPYGVRVYLTARFSAPIEIGGLPTADPLDPAVIAWWQAKVAEIYRLIPDFGGFLVKANSEGQPGPQNYGRTHADGANLLADALAPHDGIVMWRAFVYAAEIKEDRVKQAYNEFKPLDGKFRPNVVIQIKNGPLDFQPREPFHPLFGTMPRTPLALELQITQEYLGQGTNLAFLAPMWKEVLDADTLTAGPGSTVASIVEGGAEHRALSVIAGVANTGTDRNWTGHPLAQANWYAFGRLAWDPALTSAAIADEWTRLTFGSDPRVVAPLTKMLLESRDAVVDYMNPLGFSGSFAEGHHYGPEPWHDKGRPDWTSVYYHRADTVGLGVDRTTTGTNAVSQYAPEVAKRFNDLDACPEEFLLWFHHVPWDHRLKSGRILWDEFALRFQRGVTTVQGWQKTWSSLAPLVDAERHRHVSDLLVIQERDARWWRDACLLYFQTFSHRPLPEGVPPPEKTLEEYKQIKLRWMPGNPGEK